ncbi:MAG: hypothetical protein JSW20_05265 [Nitrospiraceae bacterium]|nr:MAG: hypothetical protein JSW20_05265 [Nitrospiraceae bacterium]
MKIVFLAVSLVFFALFFNAAHVGAVTGECSNCHTMHDRQGADTDIGETGAQGKLLKAGCAGCHTGPRVAAGLNSLGAPVVIDNAPPAGQGGTNTYAGGDFYWVENTDDAKGHNVIDINPSVPNPDGVLGNTPPGWDPDATDGSNGYAFGPVAGGAATWGANQLTCAGTYGCHGTRTVADSLDAVTTSHHNNADTGGGVSATSASTADTIANSYRFLGGIKGLENATWNWGENAATHNEYYGLNDTDPERDDDDPNDSYANEDTMSYFCAQCHGFFHSRIVASGAGITSPWVRHPTDIVLPGTVAKEYDDYNSDNGDDTEGDYNVDVPVARPVVPTNAQGSTNTVVAGDDTTINGAIVMCLSCHRAHGSPEDDMLRWTYSNMVVGSNDQTGCFVCHTDKN